jgi:hypothetical protein
VPQVVRECTAAIVDSDTAAQYCKLLSALLSRGTLDQAKTAKVIEIVQMYVLLACRVQCDGKCDGVSAARLVRVSSQHLCRRPHSRAAGWLRVPRRRAAAVDGPQARCKRCGRSGSLLSCAYSRVCNMSSCIRIGGSVVCIDGDMLLFGCGCNRRTWRISLREL